MKQENEAKSNTKSNKAVIMAGWDHAPHLDDEEMAAILSSCEPHLRDARAKGIPHLGSGAIYPIAVEEIQVDPFPIKPWHYRVYGMDVGWKDTAVVWGAWDKDTDTLYLYDCYKRSHAEPEIHAAAIRRRNAKSTEWPGVIDPAARGRSQVDGQQLMALYRQEGLKVRPADNAVEAGIYSVWSRLSTARLKIFKGVMSMWVDEYRMYRRNEDGKIVKEFDHLMDATRYLCHSGLKYAKRMQASKMMNTQSRDYGVS